MGRYLYKNTYICITHSDSMAGTRMSRSPCTTKMGTCLPLHCAAWCVGDAVWYTCACSSYRCLTTNFCRKPMSMAGLEGSGWRLPWCWSHARHWPSESAKSCTP